jgi:hypothetical protein
VSLSVVSEIAIVPDSECKTPTLIVSVACAKETDRPKVEAKMVFFKTRFQDRVCIKSSPVEIACDAVRKANLSRDYANTTWKPLRD